MTSNYDFFMNTDVSPYAGQWVVICNEEIVAHSISFKDAYDTAKERCGKSKPFIAMVPPADTMIL